MNFLQFLTLWEALDPIERRNRKEMVKHFLSLSRYSKWNADHSAEVAKLARDFAKYLGLDANKVAMSALTHDIGKTKIPKDILHKPGKLSDEERHTMNSHAQEANSKLNSLTGVHGRLAKLAAIYDHTQPQKLKTLQHEGHLSEEEVELIKIITIADIFEALTSNSRPYKKTFTKPEALQLMTIIDIIDKPLFEKFKHWQLRDFKNEYRN